MEYKNFLDMTPVELRNRVWALSEEVYHMSLGHDLRFLFEDVITLAGDGHTNLQDRRELNEIQPGQLAVLGDALCRIKKIHLGY